MEEGSVEEDLTRSNVEILVNHNLEICGSKGKFQAYIQVHDISAIDQRDTTQLFLCSKSSSASVFKRLVQDTNRRSEVSKRIENYRKMLEIEYENSLLPQPKTNRSSTGEVVERLMQDSDRRSRKNELIKEFKNREGGSVKTLKISPERTKNVVERLSVDRRSVVEKREGLRKNILMQEVEILQKIRDEKHPRRGLNLEVVRRISASPECKKSARSAKEEVKAIRSKEEVREIVDRLHNRSPYKVRMPFRYEGLSINAGKKDRKKCKGEKVQVDNLMLKIKALALKKRHN